MTVALPPANPKDRMVEKRFPKLFKEARALMAPMAPAARGNNPIDAQFAIMALGFGLMKKIPKYDEVFTNEAVGAPWKIPRTLPQATLINTLLSKSMSVQSSGFFKRTEFAKCVMSGDSLTVSGLLHVYFKNLGIRSELNVGVLRMKREEEGHLPLVWLTVHGTLIDNTYHYFPENKTEVFDKRMISAKRMERYSEQDPTDPDLKLAECLGSTTCPQDPRLYKAFGNTKDVEKYIVFRAGTPEVYPNMRLYSMGISEVLSELKYDTQIMLPDKWNKMCWNCERKSATLKSCKDCKEGMGMYCEAECQKADWESHKLLHKDLKANIAYWRAKAAAGGRS